MREPIICFWRSDNQFVNRTLSEYQIETANGSLSLALTQSVRYQTVTFAPAVTLAPQVQHCYLHYYSYMDLPSAYYAYLCLVTDIYCDDIYIVVVTTLYFSPIVSAVSAGPGTSNDDVQMAGCQPADALLFG